MKKLVLSSIVVEVTRRCNMCCAHCMRGDAQNADLDVDRLRVFLKDVAAIGSITFTGGEPTLNVQAIMDTLNICREYGISVNSFYVVTNGKTIPNEFLTAMIEWYAYCVDCYGEPDYCGVALSQDIYHDDILSENVAKLRALSFFRPDDKKTRDWGRYAMLNLGRARELNGNINKREPSPTRDYEMSELVQSFENEIDVSDVTLAFTVNGDILADCDYEYSSTDDIKLCSYDNALRYFEEVAKEAELDGRC